MREDLNEPEIFASIAIPVEKNIRLPLKRKKKQAKHVDVQDIKAIETYLVSQGINKLVVNGCTDRVKKILARKNREIDMARDKVPVGVVIMAIVAIVAAGVITAITIATSNKINNDHSSVPITPVKD